MEDQRSFMKGAGHGGQRLLLGVERAVVTGDRPWRQQGRVTGYHLSRLEVRQERGPSMEVRGQGKRGSSIEGKGQGGHNRKGREDMGCFFKREVLGVQRTLQGGKWAGGQETPLLRGQGRGTWNPPW